MEDEFNRAKQRLEKRQQTDRQRARREHQHAVEAQQQAAHRYDSSIEAARARRAAEIASRPPPPPSSAAHASGGRPGLPSDADEVRYETTLVAVEGDLEGEREGGVPSGPGTLQRLQSRMESADRIILPSSVLSSLDSSPFRDRLEFPLLFKLTAVATGRHTHAGVLEFSAAEHTVVLPAKVRACLGLPFGDQTEAAKWEGLGDDADLTTAVTEGEGGDSMQVDGERERERDVAMPPRDSTSSEVKVEYAPLPKGTFAKVRALDAAVQDIPDFRSTLESHLRLHHATLTVGDVLRVGAIPLKILSVLPDDNDAHAISIIDTELAVDLDVPALSRHEVPPLTLGKPESFTVGKGELRRFRSPIPPGALTSLEKGLSQLTFTLATEPPDGADLYLSVPPVTEAAPHQHHFADFAAGTKTLSISSEEIREALNSHQSQVLSYAPFGAMESSPSLNEGQQSLSWPSAIFVGVHGFIDHTTCDVTVAIEDVKARQTEGTDDGTNATTSGVEREVLWSGRVRCSNCHKLVPEASLDLHLLHCQRHCQVCPICQAVLKRSEFASHWHCPKCSQAMHVDQAAKHMEVWHTLIKCECGQEMERSQLTAHKRTECPRRLVLCRFCGNYFPAGDGRGLDHRDRLRGLTSHEAYCGSRTAECHLCGKNIQLKEMDLHMQVAHTLAEVDRDMMPPSSHPAPAPPPAAARPPPPPAPRPSKCRNMPCDERPGGESDGTESDGLCPRCRALLDSMEARTNPQQLVSRYFVQLTKGCGSRACTNTEACCTASGGPPVDAPSAAVKVLQLARAAPQIYYVCLWFS